jgi:phosphoribosylanthranilate isomerase
MTREVDALYAAALGVDALGFIFAESPRKVQPEIVRRIILSLPPFVSAVGVFVDAELDLVKHIATDCRLDWVQLHGKESPTYCTSLGVRVLKAIRVKDRDSIQTMEHYKGFVDGFVLDTYVKGEKGGTGKTFDWALAQEAKKYGPVILAGGLTPDDVGDAVKRVTPYGVDVSSGVETAPGIKDHDKMRRFVERVRTCGL